MHYTWGVSGPWFLAGYVALTLVVVLVVALARRSIVNASGGHERADGIARDPYGLAMLKEGETLTTATVVTELQRVGALEERSEEEDDVFVLAEKPYDLDPLEESVFGVL